MEKKSRLPLISNGVAERIKRLADMGWKCTTERDKYCIALSIELEHQMDRPSLRQVTEALAVFDNFASIRVKCDRDKLVLFIE